MRYQLIGVNHKSAPLEVRERLAISESGLPDACREVLRDFIAEMNAIGGEGKTPGYRVFLGQEGRWQAQTGWSRLAMVNLSLLEGDVLVVEIGANPSAPNAVLIEAGPADVAGADRHWSHYRRLCSVGA